MARLTFVRHAQSVANAGGRTLPHATIPLSSTGQAQAAWIATQLPADAGAVHVSKFDRARETARPFCARIGVDAQVHRLMHEFSAIDPARIEGLTGEQRRPLTEAYWARGDRDARMGDAADTFGEFVACVDGFIDGMDTLADGSVLFGHGIWFGLLAWWLMGFEADTPDDMRAFRAFQVALPMPNCAVYELTGTGRQWHLRYRADLARGVAQLATD